MNVRGPVPESSVRVGHLLWCVIWMILPPTESQALARRSEPAPTTEPDWQLGAVCEIQYFNVCNGWTWVWSGWPDGDRTSVAFETCGTACQVEETSMFVWLGCPPGYGHTGVVELYAVDGDLCPVGMPLASQPYLPLGVGGGQGWDTVVWGGVTVPTDFAVVFTHANGHWYFDYELSSDHPAPGPIGPPACGTCYPSTRTTRTFEIGPVGNPDCPGTPYDDFVCNAEFMWIATVSCPTHAADQMEDRSWGRVKDLYR